MWAIPLDIMMVNVSAARSGDEAEWLDACARGQPDEAQAGSGQPSQSSMRSKELEGLSSDSDVLPVPKFVNAEGASQSVTSQATTSTQLAWYAIINRSTQHQAVTQPARASGALMLLLAMVHGQQPWCLQMIGLSRAALSNALLRSG